MTSHGHAPSGKYLTAYRSRKGQRSGESAAEMSAATHIVVSVVAHGAGIVRVSRTRQPLKLVVIHRSGICVLNDRAERCARGSFAQYARAYLRHVLFLAGGGSGIITGGAAVHLKLYLIKIDLFARRKAVNYNAYSDAVALAKYRNLYIIAPCR